MLQFTADVFDFCPITTQDVIIVLKVLERPIKCSLDNDGENVNWHRRNCLPQTDHFIE